MNNKIYGKTGEDLAKNYLKKNKYKIIETNYTNKIGEIDIICFDKKSKEYVFVEVKRRLSLTYGMPREAVTEHKQHKIKNVATLYLISNKLENEKFRFDVIDILDEEITHIKYAF